MKNIYIKEINKEIKDQQHILKLLTYSNSTERQEIKNKIVELQELKTIKKYSEWTDKKNKLELVNQIFYNLSKEKLTDWQIQQIKRQDYFIGGFKGNQKDFKIYPVLRTIKGQTLPTLDFIFKSFTGATQAGTPQELAEQNTFKNWLLQGKDPAGYFFI